MEILKETALLPYLASFKAKNIDRTFVSAIRLGGGERGVPETVDRPTVFCKLTGTRIAVANQVWTSEKEYLVDQVLLEDGWTR